MGCGREERESWWGGGVRPLPVDVCKERALNKPTAPPPNLGVVAPAGVALKVPAAADGVERVALGVRVRLVGVGPEQRLEAVHVHHGALVTPEDLGEGGET